MNCKNWHSEIKSGLGASPSPGSSAFGSNVCVCPSCLPGRQSDEQNYQRVTLLATSISYVLVILDTSIVNVARENILRDLGADVTGLQWIVTAYVIVFASLAATRPHTR